MRKLKKDYCQISNKKVFNRPIWKNTIFWLLLIYSLLPGFAKIYNNQIFFLGSIPIIFSLIKPFREKPHLYYPDCPYIIFLSFIVLQSIFYLIFPGANKSGICMSIFMNVLPMLGYIYSRRISINEFCRIFIPIVIIHCILAILIYPYFNLGTATHPYALAMSAGDSMGRMTSVSGSLGFGNLIMMGLIISVIKERKFLPIIIFCWIFSAQRSAWVAGVLGILLYIYEYMRKTSIAKGMGMFIGIFIVAIIVVVILTDVLNIDLGFIEYRIGRIGGATSERQMQWVSGWNNFQNNFIGWGGGQAGQIASRHNGGIQGVKLVPDGDYFRILSEYGVVGILFFIVTLIMVFSLILLCKLSKNQVIVTAIVLGCFFQMIGSNITEFYFTNFIIWFFFGKLYLLVNKRLKIVRDERKSKSFDYSWNSSNL